jgi:gliding motility-associated-like protein
VEPTASILATPQKDTLCNGGTANISFSSPTVSTNGMQFNFFATADNPTVVSGYADGTNKTIDSTVVQTLTNNSDSAQRVVYIFSTYTLDNDGNQDCPGIGDTVDIWVEPTASILATPQKDTLCNGGTANISFSSPTVSTNGMQFNFSATADTPDSLSGYSNGMYKTVASSIMQVLTNNSNYAQRVVYIITPYTLNNNNIQECEGVSDTVEIWVEPTARLFASPANDTICNGTDASILFTSPTVSTNDIIFDYIATADNPGSVSGYSGGSNYKKDSTIIQTLINTSDTAQRVVYIFTPYTLDISGNQDCQGENDTSIIWVEPTTRIIATPIADTICSTGRMHIELSSPSVPTLPVRFLYDYANPFSGIYVTSGQRQGLDTNFIIQDKIENENDTFKIIRYSILSYTWQTAQNIPVCHGDTAYVDLYVEPVAKVTPSVDIDTLCNEDATSIALGTPTISTRGVEFNVEAYADNPVDISGYSNLTNYTTDSTIVQTLINSSNNPQRVAYVITPFNLGSDLTQYCEGDDDTVEVWVNPSPQILASALRDTLCNLETSTLSIAANSTLTSGNLMYNYTVNNVSGDTSLISGYDSSFNLNLGDFYQTLTNHSDTIQWIEYLIHPYAVNTCAGTCDNGGIHDTLLHIELLPQLQTTLTAYEYIGGRNIRCYGENNGSVTTIVEGGILSYPAFAGSTIDYTWENNAKSQNRVLITAGSYSVTVEDIHSCLTYDSITLTEPDPWVIIATLHDASCDGRSDGYIKLNVSGQSPGYTYIYSGPIIGDSISKSDSIYDLSGGQYWYQIEDTNSCASNWMQSIIDAPNKIGDGKFADTYGSNNEFNISCIGKNDGKIYPNVFGSGNPDNYTYNWIGPNGFTSTNDTIDSLFAGSYYLTVIDESGCIGYLDMTLVEPDSLDITIELINISCSNHDGQAIAIPSGGAPGYNYSWSGTSLTTDSVYGLATDITQYVTIADYNGCSASDSFHFIPPPAMLVYITITSDYNGAAISCFDSADASLNVNIQNGNPQYSYNWNTGSTDSVIHNLPAGWYYITVQDLYGCTGYDTIEVTQPDKLTYTLDKQNVLCSGEVTGPFAGKATIYGSGGTGNYDYYWSNGSDLQTAENLTDGFYRITIADANNCSADTVFEITSPQILTIRDSVVNAYCPEKPDGSITLFAEGGTTPYSYTWNDNGMIRFDYEYLPELPKGTYYVTVVDSAGCKLTKEITVDANYDMCIEIPTAFSPNGDGVNDKWDIKLIELYPNAMIEVYDRWGELVYATYNGYDDPWDGSVKNNKNDLPVESYYYIINIKKGYKPFTGVVTILK